MRLTIGPISIQLRPIEAARLIHDIAEFMESDCAPPDHWEETKREQAYQEFAHAFGPIEATFMQKILDRMEP